jgi:hypothetical protein
MFKRCAARKRGCTHVLKKSRPDEKAMLMPKMAMYLRVSESHYGEL